MKAAECNRILSSCAEESVSSTQTKTLDSTLTSHLRVRCRGIMRVTVKENLKYLTVSQAGRPVAQSRMPTGYIALRSKKSRWSSSRALWPMRVEPWTLPHKSPFPRIRSTTSSILCEPPSNCLNGTAMNGQLKREMRITALFRL
ncbi:hypothetical protein D3C76_1450210 [compost metagenome]